MKLLSKEVVANIIELSQSMNRQAIAAQLKISESTIWRYLDSDCKNRAFLRDLERYENRPVSIKDSDKIRFTGAIGQSLSYLSCPQTW